MQKRGLQAILFDMDGTLIDTIKDIQFAINGALASQSVMPMSEEQTKQVVGRGLINALKGALSLQAKQLDEQSFARMYQLMIDLYHEHPCDYSHPYEGIEAFLERLISAGLVLGILSNKEDVLTQQIVKKIFPHIDFSWVCGMKLDEPKKPDKHGVVKFCTSEGLCLGEVLYVGDSEVDYYTAQNAGCPVFLVSWGFRKKEDLHALDDAVIVDSVDELEEAIYAIQREGSEK